LRFVLNGIESLLSLFDGLTDRQPKSYIDVTGEATKRWLVKNLFTLIMFFITFFPYRYHRLAPKSVRR